MSTYNLVEIKALISQDDGTILISKTAEDTAFDDFGFTREKILQSVLDLRPEHFYKTMPSDKNPDLFQDVYRNQSLQMGK